VHVVCEKLLSEYNICGIGVVIKTLRSQPGALLSRLASKPSYPKFFRPEYICCGVIIILRKCTRTPRSPRPAWDWSASCAQDDGPSLGPSPLYYGQRPPPCPSPEASCTFERAWSTIPLFCFLIFRHGFHKTCSICALTTVSHSRD
jgi:hypothetical protein